MAILDDVKKALRVKTDYYDDEITDLIAAAQLDLGIAGVVVPAELDELVETAIKTYCKLHFGLPQDAAFLKASYDEQKAQLSNATGYTDWTVTLDV